MTAGEVHLLQGKGAQGGGSEGFFHVGESVLSH